MADSKTTQTKQDKEAVQAADFQSTQDAAQAAAPTSVSDVNPGNNPQIEVGQDKDFNSWVRKAHETGNPEQLSPMQAAQNIRDSVAGQDAGGTNNIDDPKDEDTRWVAENVKGEPVRE